MKRILINSLVAVVGISLLAGCSAKKVRVKALVPADVPVLVKKRSLAVSNFKGDKVNLSSKIEAKLAKVEIKKKKYFKVVNRNELDKIINEQKLQSSDLLDGKNAAKVGKLAGAQVLVTGSVNTSVKNGKYQDPRQVCTGRDKKGRCYGYKTVYVTCETASASISANISLYDVETGAALHAESMNKNYTGDSCKVKGWLGQNTDGKIASGEQGLANLTEQVASEFVGKLAPGYITFLVELMEKVKSVDLTSKQEKTFEGALGYIENGRIEKAEKILDKLNDEIEGKSYELLYDLAVTKEGTGKLKEAKELYTLADDTLGKPNELLDAAIKRISSLIKRQEEAEKQL